VQEGRFREDLFYRLHVVPITVPPLRERKEDIPPLVNHTLQKLAAKMQSESLGVSSDAMDVLMVYDWPGNVRELENALQFALVRTGGDTISAQSLPSWIGRGSERAERPGKPLITVVEEREREEIVRRLVQCQGKLSDVAKALGIGRTTLWRKRKRHQLLAG
jgi:DNA-binding NtrC family response regulator